MDLYISPMSGSFTAHVACLEAGLPVTLIRVDRATKRLDDGRDFRELAPQGIVPVLALPGGGLLTESVAVLQYVADQAPDKQLAPAWGTPERYRLIEWLNFVTTELHKKHAWVMFSSKTPPEMKAWARATIGPPLAHAATHLGPREYLLGDTYTVADIYLFWALVALQHGGVVLDAYPALRGYLGRIQARATVQRALAIELPMFRREATAAAAAAS